MILTGDSHITILTKVPYSDPYRWLLHYKGPLQWSLQVTLTLQRSPTVILTGDSYITIVSYSNPHSTKIYSNLESTSPTVIPYGTKISYSDPWSTSHSPTVPYSTNISYNDPQSVCIIPKVPHIIPAAATRVPLALSTATPEGHVHISCISCSKLLENIIHP